jgi:hypothetical protein
VTLDPTLARARQEALREVMRIARELPEEDEPLARIARLTAEQREVEMWGMEVRADQSRQAGGEADK